MLDHNLEVPFFSLTNIKLYERAKETNGNHILPHSNSRNLALALALSRTWAAKDRKAIPWLEHPKYSSTQTCSNIFLNTNLPLNCHCHYTFFTVMLHAMVWHSTVTSLFNIIQDIFYNCSYLLAPKSSNFSITENFLKSSASCSGVLSSVLQSINLWNLVKLTIICNISLCYLCVTYLYVHGISMCSGQGLYIRLDCT